MWESLNELKHAARRLTMAPGLTVAVLLTLALGIGANTAIFSFVNGVLLRPLPFPEPDRLVTVCETNVKEIGDWCAASPANAADWNRMSQTLEAVGLARSWTFNLKTEARVPNVRGGIATPEVFPSFRVKPALGRLFRAQDAQPGNEHVMLISHRLWKSQFGGSPGAVGRRVDLDSEPYEIVGVLPEGFELPYLESTDLWIPLWPERQNRRDWRGFIPFGRLKEGVSLAQAQAEMDTVRARLATEYPESNRAWGVAVESLKERITRPVRPMLLLFLGAVGLVLLIACANVANLLLVSSLAQERSHALRLALGATRARLMRAQLAECLLLSLTGGALGVLIALWAVDLFLKLAPDWFPRVDGVHVNLPVLCFTTLLCLLTSLACAVAPALHATGVNLQAALGAGRSASERRVGLRTRNILVVTEIALALVLLVGAGLLIRTFANLADWQPGFDRDNLVIVQLFSSPGKYPKPEQVADLFRRAAEEVRTLPSVVSVGEGSAVPLFGGDGTEEFYIEGRPIPAPGERQSVAWFDADPSYFRTLRVPLLRGRQFTPQDRAGSLPVAIINETMARRYWPNGDAIGKRIRMLAHQKTLTVVGVVHDVQPFRPDQYPEAQIFWPFAQLPRWAVQLVVRTSSDPNKITPAIAARLGKVDPDMEIGRFHSMNELVNAQLTNPRFSMTLAMIFAVIAVATAAVGIYGMVSFSVSQRRREIGIRMAVGARRAEILRLVMRNGITLVAWGLALGLGGALGLAGLLKSLLVGVAPDDPGTLAGVSIVLIGVVLAACYLPARRAAAVDPMEVLRHE